MCALELHATAPAECRNCGAPLAFQSVRSTFTSGEHLVAVDGIPAYVCRACGEHHYDQATALVLEMLRGDGFPADDTGEHGAVPVFRLGDLVAKTSH